jgi:hypothetical protein
MDFQVGFNVALSVISVLAGILIQSMRESMAALKKTDAELITKVQAIEVLVAGEYVKDTDLEKLSHALFAKLDKIEDKLDLKADKP